MLKNILLIYFQKSKLADFEPKLTILSPYISVNTHARAILSSENDSNRKNNSEKLLYMLKNVLLMYFQKSKLADFWTKFGFYKGKKYFLTKIFNRFDQNFQWIWPKFFKDLAKIWPKKRSSKIFEKFFFLKISNFQIFQQILIKIGSIEAHSVA